VILCHSRNDAHQDHREVSMLTWNTFRDHAILEYEVPKWDGDLSQPNVFIPASRTLMERKAKLLYDHFGTQPSRDGFDAQTFMGLHFEVPNAIARAVLFRDPTTRPLGGPVVEVCAVAKRDLSAGEVLDDYGMYMTYGEAVNTDEMSTGRYLPEGLVQGCRLKRRIAKDAVITYDDVILPAGRLADRLRAEQYRKFRGETWLNELLTAPQVTEQVQSAVLVDS
jgi:predicted homoserine dehydrogenase-like protein